MRKTCLIFMNVLLSSIMVWAQHPSEEKFPLPARYAQLGFNPFNKPYKASSYLLDSLYFYRSDFDDFNTASEIRKVKYKGETDSLSNIDIYYHSAMTKSRNYNMAHSIRYSYYQCGDMKCVQEIFYDTDGQGNE